MIPRSRERSGRVSTNADSLDRLLTVALEAVEPLSVRVITDPHARRHSSVVCFSGTRLTAAASTEAVGADASSRYPRMCPVS
jgi:hypothetical protein